MICAEDLVGPWFRPKFEVTRDVAPIYELGKDRPSWLLKGNRRGDLYMQHPIDVVYQRSIEEIQQQEDQKFLQMVQQPLRVNKTFLTSETWEDIKNWQKAIESYGGAP